MLHHIELYVRDLERSAAFWTPLMALLGFEEERWSGGINYARGKTDTYLCLLPAAREHLDAGYHRKRIGLNHLAFKGESRAQVDLVAKWIKDNGHTLLYEDRHPYAGGPDYYAVFFEDPDRIKLEVVAPTEASPRTSGREVGA
jgi:catechol 2,3-dioxygenase-like lactoylglutathione lyase family enzyme